jgi:hypothetical protein
MSSENYEEMAIMNSELRFITVELMKIALEKNLSFDQVMAEYFQNAYKLKRKILTLHVPRAFKMTIRQPAGNFKR